MKNVLVLTTPTNGRIRRETLSAIAAAEQASRILGGTFSILLLGHDVADCALNLASYGAKRVLVCDDPSLRDFTAENFAPTAAHVGAQFRLVLAAASTFGKDLVPRVAARIGSAYASDCTAIRAEDDGLLFERPMCAGNVLSQCRMSTAIQTATIRQSEFAPAESVRNQTPSPIEHVALVSPGKAAERIEIVSYTEVESERPELSEAATVVSGGRPLGARFLEVLEPLANELGAAIGATRALCDGGHAPGNYQVGQTGKVIAPDLYLALGVSGALQHLAGMRSSRCIVAINRDPDAPIFQVSDYGLVADLFSAVPALTCAIRDWRQAQSTNAT